MFKVILAIILFSIFISGLGCFVYAAFLVSKIFGFIVLGTSLMTVLYNLEKNLENY